MATRPLIRECLQILNVNGVDPYTRNCFSGVRLAFTFILAIVVWFDSFLDLALKWRGLNSMESVVVFTGLTQLITKMCILLRESRSFIEVIDKMNQFWPVDKYGSLLQNEIKNTFSGISKIMKFMVVFFIVVVSVFCVDSFLVTPRKIPFALYHPTDTNKSPDYEIMFGLEMTLAIVIAFLLLGFDFLFVSLIVNIACELKIIKKGIQHLPINLMSGGDSDASLKELCVIIDHHNLILECIKNVKRIYSFWLLNIYFYNMVEMCGGLLSMIATGFPPTVESFSKYGMFTIFYMAQLYFYCAVGQYLITESLSVSDSAYAVKWCVETQPELRRALLLMIQRANKAENLTAGGMFALNLESFTKVTRSALSFFTLGNAVYRDV